MIIMAFTDKNEIHLLQPRLMVVNQNFEMQFSVITGADGMSLTAEGNFRSDSDQGGMFWYSKDAYSYPILTRPIRNDFTGIVLEYDYILHGDLPDMDALIGQSLTIRLTDGQEYYAQLWHYTTDRPLGSVCDKKIEQWEDPHYCWRYNGSTMVRYDDPFYRDTIFPAGRTPGVYNPRQGHVKIDFNNLYGGWLPFELASFYVNETYIDGYIDVNDTVTWDYLHSHGWGLGQPRWQWVKIDPTKIEWLQWGFIPSNYVGTNPQYIPLEDSSWFKMEFTNWGVTQGNSLIMTIPPPTYNGHGFHFADAYDDNTPMTPEWLLYQMYYLGFRDWINFYIGASHFYDKKGLRDVNGNPIPDIGGYRPFKYVIKTDYPFNAGFESWYKNYLQLSKEYGYKVISSISMENVDAPEAWWQRAYDGTPATTGWVPTPKMLSFTNVDVQEFYKKYVKALCDFADETSIVPIIQLGEPWWWYIDRDGVQLPCFYDAATKELHLLENGFNLPNITSLTEDRYENVLYWLREKNGEFAHLLRDHIRTYYPNAQFTVLFFPPTVVDKDRVTKMMQIVNFPIQEWERISSKNNLDFFQIEDYDWVIANEWDKNRDVYYFPGRQLGYQFHNTQYFAGFLLPYYDAMTDWVPVFLEPIAAGSVLEYNETGPTVSISFDIPDMNDYTNRLIKFITPDGSQEIIDIVSYNRMDNMATLSHPLSMAISPGTTRLYILPWENEYREKLWNRVNLAALKGKSKGETTFIWSSPQILRQQWQPPHNRNIMEMAREFPYHISLNSYFEQTPIGKENMLDLSALQLSSYAGGSTIVHDAERSNLTILNKRYPNDLFAYIWVDVEPYANYSLADMGATQATYVYADYLYGTVVVFKPLEQRKVIFNVNNLTKILVAFYVASGGYTGEWTNISLRKV